MVRVPQTTHNLAIRQKRKYAKSYNARTQLLFCSFYLFFGDVLVAVIVLILSYWRLKAFNRRCRCLNISHPLGLLKPFDGPGCFILFIRSLSRLIKTYLMALFFNCPRRVLAQRPKSEEALIGPPAYKECEILV